ncbi:MAG: hypothetical protein ACE15E_00415 [Acidobacteriota bacterium]
MFANYERLYQTLAQLRVALEERSLEEAHRLQRQVRALSAVISRPPADLASLSTADSSRLARLLQDLNQQADAVRQEWQAILDETGRESQKLQRGRHYIAALVKSEPPSPRVNHSA